MREVQRRSAFLLLKKDQSREKVSIALLEEFIKVVLIRVVLK